MQVCKQRQGGLADSCLGKEGMWAALGPLLIIEFMAHRVWLGLGWGIPGPLDIDWKAKGLCLLHFGEAIRSSSLAFLVVTLSRYLDSWGLNLGYRR